MINSHVRVEQDTANSLVIRDLKNKEICNFITEESIIPHEMWENAKQIVRLINKDVTERQKAKKQK